MKSVKIIKHLYFIFLASVLFACGGSDNKLSDYQMDTFVNKTNSFEFQVSNIDKVTDETSYSWTNEGTKAKIDLSSTLTDGSGTVTIKDAAGTIVYSSDITTNGSINTSKGATGTWTIEVKLTKASGTLNFNVEKN